MEMIGNFSVFPFVMMNKLTTRTKAHLSEELVPASVSDIGTIFMHYYFKKLVLASVHQKKWSLN
jgi:hypothetical protein